MKKTYLKPTMTVVKIQHRSRLLTGSPYDSYDNSDLNTKKGQTLADDDYIF